MKIKTLTKKSLALVLAAGLVMSAGGCSGSNGNNSGDAGRIDAQSVRADNQAESSSTASEGENTTASDESASGESSTPSGDSSKRTQYPLTMTTYGPDGREYSMTFEKAPERVVAVYQGCIETLLALGLEDQIGRAHV